MLLSDFISRAMEATADAPADLRPSEPIPPEAPAQEERIGDDPAKVIPVPDPEPDPEPTVEESSPDRQAPDPERIHSCETCAALGRRDGDPWCFARVIFDGAADRGKPVSEASSCDRWKARPEPADEDPADEAVKRTCRTCAGRNHTYCLPTGKPVVINGRMTDRPCRLWTATKPELATTA